jgi:hypothetical protein
MITDAVVDQGSGILYKCKYCDQTYIAKQKFRTTLSISISLVEYCKYVEAFFPSWLHRICSRPAAGSWCTVIIGGNQVSPRNFDVAIASIDIYHFYKIKFSPPRYPRQFLHGFATIICLTVACRSYMQESTK